MATQQQLNKLEELFAALTENLNEEGDLIWDHTWQAFEDYVVSLLGEDWRHDRDGDIWAWTDDIWMELDPDED